MIITSTPAEIGKRIKEIRRSKEMSQEELGNKIGVTKATINKYEYGQVNFPRDRIEKLARALNVTPSYLLGWDDDMMAEYVPTKKSRLFDPTIPAQAPDLYSTKTEDSHSHGHVSWFNSKKGYGFITDEDKHEDTFVHFSAIQPDNIKQPTIQANDPIMAELVRIYAELSIKDRNKLLTYAYELEDKKCEQ